MVERRPVWGKCPSSRRLPDPKLKLGLHPGDHVLVGAPGVSMPSDWFLATVLWADKTDVLTEHQPPGGPSYRQVLSVAQVRAVGSIAELNAYREACREAVAELVGAVRTAENTLAAARAAIWQKLDEIAAHPLTPQSAPELPLTNQEAGDG